MAAQRKRNRKPKKQRRLNEVKDKEVVSVDWAGLPQGILEIVFERLSLVDCISVSNVCKLWRNVFSRELCSWERLGFPSLLMSGQKDRERRICISMLEKRAWEMELPEARGKYCWGSFQDWLILVDDVQCYSLNVSLFNPFTRSKIKLPKTWDFYHKMVLSGRPCLQNCVCMLVHGERRELAFWVPGAQSWHEFRLAGEPFEDAVFCNGSFYLLSKDDGIFQIETARVSSILRRDDASTAAAAAFDSEIKTEFHKVIMSEDHVNDGVLRYLVESCGEVLLVYRQFSTSPGAVLETRNFKVYALDVAQMSWKRVENLGNQILFLGKCSSRSFSAAELGISTDNCIYFANDDVSPWLNEWHSLHLKGMSSRLGLDNSGRKHWGIFRLGNRDNVHFCFRGDRDNWGPIWVTAPLWWYCNNFRIN